MPSYENPRTDETPRGKGRRRPWPVRVFMFYRDGFREMTVGRKLWTIILVKLFVLFAVVKVLFFPDLLKRDYDTDSQRSEAVRTSLLDRGSSPVDTVGEMSAAPAEAADSLATR